MRRTDRPDARAVAAALAERMPFLAQDLLGPPNPGGSAEWRWGRKGSLAVHVAGPKRGRFFNNEAREYGDALDLIRRVRGGTLSDAIRWALDWLGDPGTVQMPPAIERAPEAAVSADLARKAEAARRIWSEARPAAGSPAETYLRGRGLELPAEAPLRFHPACPRGRERLPAMVALMTDPATGQPSGGVHRTFLAPDGHGKAAGQAKMMLGPAGVVRLVPDAEISAGLGLAEGIETALATMQRYGWRPVWAAGSSGGIRSFPVLAGIETLTVWADADDGGACLQAARSCLERWQATGREGCIRLAPQGLDFADLAGRVA